MTRAAVGSDHNLFTDYYKDATQRTALRSAFAAVEFKDRYFRWSIDMVALWLQIFGLGQYSKDFVENGYDGTFLLQMLDDTDENYDANLIPSIFDKDASHPPVFQTEIRPFKEAADAFWPKSRWEMWLRDAPFPMPPAAVEDISRRTDLDNLSTLELTRCRVMDAGDDEDEKMGSDPGRDRRVMGVEVVDTQQWRHYFPFLDNGTLLSQQLLFKLWKEFGTNAPLPRREWLQWLRARPFPLKPESIDKLKKTVDFHAIRPDDRNAVWVRELSQPEQHGDAHVEAKPLFSLPPVALPNGTHQVDESVEALKLGNKFSYVFSDCGSQVLRHIFSLRFVLMCRILNVHEVR
jgi:hypothetical protein